MCKDFNLYKAVALGNFSEKDIEVIYKRYLATKELVEYRKETMTKEMSSYFKAFIYSSLITILLYTIYNFMLSTYIANMILLAIFISHIYTIITIENLYSCIKRWGGE
jgi:hypothetical protein